MGVNCNCVVPYRARIKDVAEVIGILAGLRPEESPIAGSSSFFMRVPGVSVETPVKEMPEMAHIVLKAQPGERLIDGETEHFTSYHFESDSGDGFLMLPRSTPFWIAVMRGVVKFFGGYLFYDDCGDMEEPDFMALEKTDIHATNDAEWDAFQRRKFNLKPLTKGDLEACRQ